MPALARARTVELRACPEPHEPDQTRALRRILESTSLFNHLALDVALTKGALDAGVLAQAILSLTIGLALLGYDLEEGVDIALTRAEFQHQYQTFSSSPILSG